MLPILPFIAGAVIGVAGVLIAGDKRTKKKLIEGKKYIEERYEEGKESVVAISECVQEKVKSKKTEAETKADEAESTDEPK